MRCVSHCQPQAAEVDMQEQQPGVGRKCDKSVMDSPNSQTALRGSILELGPPIVVTSVKSGKIP